MPSAATGGIQWSGTDFQGYKDGAWVSLTSAAVAQISGSIATFTTTQTTQSTTYVDVPGYTSSITVTTSNIINVQVTTEVETHAGMGHLKLVRVISGTPTDLYEQEMAHSVSSTPQGHFNVSYADQHGQSSGTVITYKLMFKSTGSLNDFDINPDNQNAQIFLQEMTTSAISVTSVNGANGVVVLDTDDIAEGSTNLYYTDARWDTKMAAADTDDLSQGSTNLYHQNDLGGLT
jgi:hypothetical protein